MIQEGNATFALLQREGEETEAGLGHAEDIPGCKEENKRSLPFCRLSAL